MVRGFLLVAALLAVGCGGADGGSEAPCEGSAGGSALVAGAVCEAGRVAECPCAGSDATGIQTCNADGAAWGGCTSCPGVPDPSGPVALCEGPLAISDQIICPRAGFKVPWRACDPVAVSSGRCLDATGYYCCAN